ncbi:hypothetical protein IHQ68_14080 [Chelatococcus sambhunathii]|uniref:Phosphatidate cytidylyltransferase n=1 Tax=Chelatococcus sambhunathii TaxID=363953 RepID=A0ABU1DHZ4_9HYPH|nr:hypothetical protein [Chelatococcus sambhunathii]MDR4307748.1 hypothetical protein [Chelatococcus sambhunathii]
MTEAAASLIRFVAGELDRPIAPAVTAFAAELAARGGRGVVGVLFYGSALRTGATDGLLDFYILLDELEAWDQTPFQRAGNRRLPPNVEYAETTAAGMTLRAKLAVMTLAQFVDHARAKSLDTTIWARFAQPAGLAWRRDLFAGAQVAEAVAGACRAAAWWAAHLGPERGRAADFWQALFSRTYASELRVEGVNRPGSIIDAAPERYDAMLRLAWAAEGIAFGEQEGDSGGAPILAPHISDQARADAKRAWRTRSRLAKPLNLARLAKAAFTFSGGADYVAWKIERHSGHKEIVTPFQRRHPLLAAGPALWRLWRKGVLR